MVGIKEKVLNRLGDLLICLEEIGKDIPPELKDPPSFKLLESTVSVEVIPAEVVSCRPKYPGFSRLTIFSSNRRFFYTLNREVRPLVRGKVSRTRKVTLLSLDMGANLDFWFLGFSEGVPFLLRYRETRFENPDLPPEMIPSQFLRIFLLPTKESLKILLSTL